MTVEGNDVSEGLCPLETEVAVGKFENKPLRLFIKV